MPARGTRIPEPESRILNPKSSNPACAVAAGFPKHETPYWMLPHSFWWRWNRAHERQKPFPSAWKSEQLERFQWNNRVNNLKDFHAITRKTRPEPGIDCLICAISSRQRPFVKRPRTQKEARALMWSGWCSQWNQLGCRVLWLGWWTEPVAGCVSGGSGTARRGATFVNRTNVAPPQQKLTPPR